MDSNVDNDFSQIREEDKVEQEIVEFRSEMPQVSDDRVEFLGDLDYDDDIGDEI